MSIPGVVSRTGGSPCVHFLPTVFVPGYWDTMGAEDFVDIADVMVDMANLVENYTQVCDVIFAWNQKGSVSLPSTAAIKTLDLSMVALAKAIVSSLLNASRGFSFNSAPFLPSMVLEMQLPRVLATSRSQPGCGRRSARLRDHDQYCPTVHLDRLRWPG